MKRFWTLTRRRFWRLWWMLIPEGVGDWLFMRALKRHYRDHPPEIDIFEDFDVPSFNRDVKRPGTFDYADTIEELITLLDLPRPVVVMNPEDFPGIDFPGTNVTRHPFCEPGVAYIFREGQPMFTFDTSGLMSELTAPFTVKDFTDLVVEEVRKRSMQE